MSGRSWGEMYGNGRSKTDSRLHVLSLTLCVSIYHGIIFFLEGDLKIKNTWFTVRTCTGLTLDCN
jgi:hypothetical protein